MLYTNKISHAIKFAIKTHEIYQKQKRKGKDIPYITHPLTVGIILSHIGASEDTIIAGILHDTIEDSVSKKKATKEMIAKRFGEEVAKLVMSVTETNKELPWEERKREALKHIHSFSHDSLLVKSADILSNTTELIDDHKKNGDKVFERFGAPKEKVLENQLRLITAILNEWPENPLSEDLRYVAGQLEMIGALIFMMREPGKIVLEWGDYNENIPLECPVCGWKGTPKSSEYIEYHDVLLDVSCPNCDKMLLIANYPLVKLGRDE